MDRVQASLCRSILRQARQLRKNGVSDFRMPAVTELWGTGVYQEEDLHYRSLKRMLPKRFHPYVPSVPSRYQIRRDILEPWWGAEPQDDILIDEDHPSSLGAKMSYVEDDFEEVVSNFTNGAPSKNVGSSVSSASSTTRLPKPSLESIDTDAFDLLRALKYQEKIAECSSAKETNGLLVEAVTGYTEAISHPGSDRYVFSYNVRFSNITTDKTFRIIGRSFVFANKDGKITTAIRHNTKECMGIVGFTPVIRPGDQFLYGSGTTFNTDRGSIVGSFHVIEDKVRSPDFEMKSLKERYEYFDKLIRKNNMEEHGTSFRAGLAQTKFSTHVPSGDVNMMAGS